MKKIIVLIVILMSFSLFQCGKKDFEIGFSVALSGETAEFGEDVRNAFLLKIEEVNKSGGIHGRNVTVVIKDDENDLNKVRINAEAFIEEGIFLVFGHDFSSKTEAVLSSIEGENIIYYSPTMSSPSAIGIIDNYYKAMSSVNLQGQMLGKYLEEKYNHTLFICDKKNQTYADEHYENFVDNFSGRTNILSYMDLSTEDLAIIINEVIENKYDSIVLISNPNDTVSITKLLKTEGLSLGLFSSNWGMTSEVVTEAGNAIDGLIYLGLFDELDSEEYLVFSDSYKKSYNKDPSIAAIYSYDAAEYLIEVLKMSDELNYESITESFRETKSIEGISSTISLDKYGDGIRETYFYIVEGGQLKLLGGE